MRTFSRSLCALGIAMGLMVLSPAVASARESYCSPSGDLCYGVRGDDSPLRLGITLAAKYFTRYRLCVTAPDGSRDCRRFRITKRTNGTFGSVIRWRRHFPYQGPGTYRARWRLGVDPLGPAISFKRR